MPKLVMIAIVAVSLLGCQSVSEPEGERTHPNATETADAIGRQRQCERLVPLVSDPGVFARVLGYSKYCSVLESDPLGCSDEFAALQFGSGSPFCAPDDPDGCPMTDFFGSRARTTIDVIRQLQDLECAGAGEIVDIAATQAAEYFLLGQPNVPEALKRQLLPATKRWIAGSDPAARSEALDEMAMLASLYRAANPGQVIIFVARTTSAEVVPVESDWKVRNMEWQIQDLERDVNRLNEDLNP